VGEFLCCLPAAVAWLGDLPQSIAVVRSPATFQNTDWPGIDTGAPLREDTERAPACARDSCGEPLPESRASITEPIILWPVDNCCEVIRA
jgi:hypothetical protein